MAVICNKPLGPFEWLGRNLVETPTINKQGVVKDKVVYPKMKADEEPGRTHLFIKSVPIAHLRHLLFQLKFLLHFHTSYS